MSRAECPGELSQQSQLSPGLVADDEPIVYVLVDPLTSQNGSVKAFSKSKLKDGSLSVCRAAHCTAAEADSAVLQPLLGKHGRSFDGALWTDCRLIRGIALAETAVGAFCVMDDGLPGYSAHALLAYSQVEEKLRNEREAARGALTDLFRQNGVKRHLQDCPFRIS